MRQVKEERRAAGRETLVTVAGCVAQAEGDEIVARPVVDIVVGPQSYHRLRLVSRARVEPRQIVEIAFPEEDKFAHLPERHGAKQASAFLTVQGATSSVRSASSPTRAAASIRARWPT